jgi:hypothetical protein
LEVIHDAREYFCSDARSCSIRRIKTATMMARCALVYHLV